MQHGPHQLQCIGNAGQQKPTRIIRLLAEHSIETAILGAQAQKAQMGDDNLLAVEGDMQTSSVLNMLAGHP